MIVVLTYSQPVGLDPRGIGSSTPIKCDIDLFNERVSLFPQTETDFTKLVQDNTAVGESCIKLSGNIVRHMDTRSVTRDHDAVRQALGSDKFNFLAFSYGTLLAATYAELFPHNVGRMVMDANIDHSQTETYFHITETATYENEFNRFAQWCRNSPQCALQGKDVAGLFDSLVQKADTTPIPAPACDQTCRKDVTGEELRFNVQGNLILKPETWPLLGLGLAQALEGNATLLSTPLAVQGQTEANTALFANIAVGCLDWTHPITTLSGLLYENQAAAAIAPHTQGACQSYGYVASCIGWPAKVQYPPHRMQVQDTPPILMVNALHDPETSYTWAVALQEQIPSAVLLTRRGDGHTSYSLGGEAAEAMDAFLIEGKVPEANTVVDSQGLIGVQGMGGWVFVSVHCSTGACSAIHYTLCLCFCARQRNKSEKAALIRGPLHHMMSIAASSLDFH